MQIYCYYNSTPAVTALDTHTNLWAVTSMDKLRLSAIERLLLQVSFHASVLWKNWGELMLNNLWGYLYRAYQMLEHCIQPETAQIPAHWWVCGCKFSVVYCTLYTTNIIIVFYTYTLHVLKLALPSPGKLYTAWKLLHRHNLLSRSE